MPFLPDDGSGESAGRTGSALPAATLVVQPDKIFQLKRRLEDRLNKIHDFMGAEGDRLRVVPPPGGDPCSRGGVQALGRNGAEALQALDGFVQELLDAIDALNEAARQYGLVEESNAEKFRQAPG